MASGGLLVQLQHLWKAAQYQACALLQTFDELLLLKRGGKVIFNGPTGAASVMLVSYFEGIEGVAKVRDGISPATWMLEVSAVSAEQSLGQDFADIYTRSELFRCPASDPHVHLTSVLLSTSPSVR